MLHQHRERLSPAAKLAASGAAALALIGLSLWAIDARSDRGKLSRADRTACQHATSLRKVKGLASFGPYFIARLRNFDITGVSGPSGGVATAPLYPRYPTALLTGDFGIEARHRLTASVSLSAFYCAGGGSVGLFSFTGHTGGPNLPRPASASLVESAGSRQATLHWPPPISAPPDPPKWLVTPYFYKPGLAVIRFSRHGRLIDHLTFKVCAAGGPDLTCE